MSHQAHDPIITVQPTEASARLSASKTRSRDGRSAPAPPWLAGRESRKQPRAVSCVSQVGRQPAGLLDLPGARGDHRGEPRNSLQDGLDVGRGRPDGRHRRLRGLGRRRGGVLEGVQERRRGLDGRIVRAVGDHVQGPAVPVGRVLGDRQRSREIAPAPDQRDRSADQVQLRCRDRRAAELGHQRAEGGLLALGAGAGDVVGAERHPARRHPLPEPPEVVGAVPPQSVVGACRSDRTGSRSGPRRSPAPAAAAPARTCPPGPAAAAGRCADGVPGRDGPAQRVPDQDRPARAGVLDQRVEPAEHPIAGRAGRRRFPRPRAPAGRGRSPGISATRSGSTSVQWVAFPHGPCSRTSGGPEPPSSTAVGMPASSTVRSVTGSPASSWSRTSIPAGPPRTSRHGRSSRPPSSRLHGPRR